MASNNSTDCRHDNSNSQQADPESTEATKMSDTSATENTAFHPGSAEAGVRRSSDNENHDVTSTTIDKNQPTKKEKSDKPTKTVKSRSSRKGSSSCTISRTVALRIVLVASLIVAAVICAAGSFLIIRGLEDEVGKQTYASIAVSALQNAQAITLRKVQGGVVLSSVLSFAFPDPAQWPLVGLDGFAETADKIAQLASTVALGFMPMVRPEQQAAFEAHAAQLYQDQGYPEGAGMSDFGRVGIWSKVKPNATYPDGHAPHTPNDTDWGTKNIVSLVVLQHNIVPSKSLMFDIHSEVFRGTALDSLLDCGASTDAPRPHCGVTTDWVELISRPGPAGLLYQPVYPANEPSTVAGVVGTSIHWEEVLTNIVPSYVDGLTCVVSTATGAQTYEIHNGIPELLGPGDRHDTAYEEFGRSIILNDIETGASASETYTLTVYPTRAMFEEFHTSSPMAVALAFMGVIVLCTAIFFLYDFLMRHEAHQRQLVLEMKRRFVRFISHEIRTPLNTVCMGLELLESEFRDKKSKRSAERQRAMVDNHDETSCSEEEEQELDVWMDVTQDVKENAHTAVNILNDLLNYDRIEAGAMKLELGKVSMWDVVAQTVSQFKIQAVNRQIKLNLTMDNKSFKTVDASDLEAGTSIHPETFSVIGDDTRLRQVIRNLISNALKFTPPDGSVTVTASYDRYGLPDAEPLALPEGDHDGIVDPTRAGSIRVVVKDTGAGMSKEQLSKLYVDFTQFDANKLQHGGGSGLGLAIAEGIVTQHSGTIKAESDGPGLGTTFTVELPLYDIPREVDSPDTETTASSMSLHGMKQSAKGRRILVVDDAQSSLKMLIRLLDRAGHSCVGAGNGQEAVDAVAADLAAFAADQSHIPFDTILCDYEMPVMNGPEAVQRIREMGCTARIFGVTGNVMKEDVDFFLEHGADEVLSKPINMSVLKGHWARHARSSFHED